MITMIVSTSGHVLLSITVYLEGLRFAVSRSLVWREPVVATPVHGRLRTDFPDFNTSRKLESNKVEWK